MSAGSRTSSASFASTLCLWRPAGTSIPVFSRAGVDAVAARLGSVGDLEHATVHATLVPPPRFSLVPFRSDPVALVTLVGPTPRSPRRALCSARSRVASSRGTP